MSTLGEEESIAEIGEGEEGLKENLEMWEEEGGGRRWLNRKAEGGRGEEERRPIFVFGMIPSFLCFTPTFSFLLSKLKIRILNIASFIAPSFAPFYFSASSFIFGNRLIRIRRVELLVCCPHK